ncbi:MAG TPA: hypothetical protein VKI64_07115 [Acidimicrobiales bacterium]|nr:hypothetical protein [Acidimicrobiales bacterium]
MAGVVGVAIALSSIRDGPAAAALLRLVGYPVACAAIVRWVPIVRFSRLDWLVAHELGMAAICVGWAIAGRWSGVAVNGAWLLIALVWWVMGARPRAGAGTSAPPEHRREPQ